jgi:hypothetical protein
MMIGRFPCCSGNRAALRQRQANHSSQVSARWTPAAREHDGLIRFEQRPAAFGAAPAMGANVVVAVGTVAGIQALAGELDPTVQSRFCGSQQRHKREEAHAGEMEDQED